MGKESRGISLRTTAWLAIGLGWSLVFWLVVWPELLAYCAASGVALTGAVWLYERGRLPRARVVSPVERTWRRYE